MAHSRTEMEAVRQAEERSLRAPIEHRAAQYAIAARTTQLGSVRLVSMRALLFGIAILFYCNASSALTPGFARISLEHEPTTLDWQSYRDSTDRFVAAFIMRGLLRYSELGKIECDLCESYQIEGPQYEFKLKSGLVWSDGVPLRAKHFVDGFLRLKSQSLPISHEFKVLREMKGKNDTLTLTLEKKSASFIHLLTLPPSFPIRKDVLKKSAKTMASRTVLGPYQVAEWVKGRHLVIEKNPEFKGKLPVHRFRFVFGKHSDLVKQFKAGKLDILSNPTTGDVLRFQSNRLQMSNPYWATRILAFQQSKRPMGDPSFRKALLYALDRGGLASLLRNGERSATGLIPPGITGHRSKALLKENRSQAQVERHRAIEWPKKVSIRLIAQKSTSEKMITDWLKDRFSKIHVLTTIELLDNPNFFKKLEAGNFDLALYTWTFRYASAIDLLKTLTSSSRQNYGRWSNETFDRLLTQYDETQGESGSEKLIDQMSRLIESEDIAVLPIGFPAKPFLLGRRVKNFAITPFGEPNLVKIEMK